jgi:hypothetical protein
MCEAFRNSAVQASVTSARAVQAAWMDDHGVTGDVTLVANVTYFIGDIVPFVEKLVAASRRRVIITVWTTPPPDRMTIPYEVVTGEPLSPSPAHRQLLPVLWDMGILPDVRVLPDRFPMRGAASPTRSGALRACAESLDLGDVPRVARKLGEHFSELFSYDEEKGVLPAYFPDARELLITWEV